VISAPELLDLTQLFYFVIFHVKWLSLPLFEGFLEEFWPFHHSDPQNAHSYMKTCHRSH